MTDNTLGHSLVDARPVSRPAAEIIVGVDDDAASGGALLCAAQQSRLTGLPLHVVHVWQVSALSSIAAAPGAHPYRTAAAADARARATRRVVGILGVRTDVRWTLEVIQGAPGPALVARSATARLLVLGRGERIRRGRPALGSVSHYCMSRAMPPILTVPATTVVPGPRPGVG